MRKYKSLIVFFIFFSILFVSLGLATYLNHGMRKIGVAEISLENDSLKISGVLYSPKMIPSLTIPPIKQPGVVLIHGVMNAKETMSGIALELARRGIFALSIDATGHGDSNGNLEESNDPTLGGLTAVNYLKNLGYVDENAIGLIGHSMGASAIRATSFLIGNISTHIFIAGGISSRYNTSIYGEFNTTNPSNLLVAIGRYDEAVTFDEVEDELKAVFGTENDIITNQVYGSFINQTARKFIMPNTNHLLEPFNNEIVRESVRWVFNSTGATNDPFDKSAGLPPNVLFPYRDLLILIGIVSFIGLIFPLAEMGLKITFFLKRKEEKEIIEPKYGLWKIGIIWGLLHLVLFVPPILLFGMGSVIIPLSLGTTAIFWVLTLAITGGIIIFFISKKREPERSSKNIIKGLGMNFTNWRGLILSIDIFLILVILILIIEIMPGINLKMFVPLFSNFSWLRGLMFLLLVPFMFLYFSIDGMMTIGMYQSSVKEETKKHKTLATLEVIGIKLLPFILVLLIQYIPLIFFDFMILSGFLGFSMQFIIMIVPLFLVYTLVSVLFYEKTRTVETGALLNALLFAWTLSILLPIG